jgi:hypothetical protein
MSKKAIFSNAKNPLLERVLINCEMDVDPGGTNFKPGGG